LNKYNILDLFCGGGGISMGIHLALEEKGIAHKITGIDIEDQPDYPFSFIKRDITKLKKNDVKGYDFYHASCPCQKFSTVTRCAILREQRRGNPDYAPEKLDKKYPNHIPFVRNLLLETGKPFVLENVYGAPLRKDLLLCGTMFDLQVLRHRIFEIHGFVCYQPSHPKHDGNFIYVCTKQQNKEENLEVCKKAMGIDWMTSFSSLGEAIPPAYSKYIFSEFLNNNISLMDFINPKRELGLQNDYVDGDYIG